MQGGGHGPAVHDHGLGADQVLEATVVTACGDIVTASPCYNSDLFFAIRGGGGGTYGVVISTVIKAYPTRKVAAIQYAFAPRSNAAIASFMDALADIYTAYPDLSDIGFNGYGSWAIASPTPIWGNHTIGFRQVFAIFGKTEEEALALFKPFSDTMEKYSSSLYSDLTSYGFDKYVDYYNTLSGVIGPVGYSAAVGSRLLDRKALTSSRAALSKMLNITAGTPEQFASTNIALVGGGQVFRDASDPYSGVNPAWRDTYLENICARGWPPGSPPSVTGPIQEDVTNVKLQALKDLAPDSGTYMNEVSDTPTNFCASLLLFIL